jgi:hypothetical protein
VLHEPQDLVRLHKSPQAFADALESFFAEHVKYHEKEGSFLPNPYYW